MSRNSEFVIVCCIIRGNNDESECTDLPDTTSCSFIMPNRDINSNSIHAFFPYEGRFHFRISTPGYKLGFQNIDYVWLDINETCHLDFLNETTIEIQANIISFSENEMSDSKSEMNVSGTRSDIDDYLAKVKSGFEKLPRMPRQNTSQPSISYSQRNTTPQQSSSHTKHGQHQLLNSVTEGATNLWKIASNTAKATVQHLSKLHGNTVVPLSDLSESNLADLSDHLGTSFDESNATHQQLLVGLWKVQYPDQINAYSRKSLKWKDAGWQNDDPVTDLKASGILALHALIYFGNKFTDMSVNRIAVNKANIKTNYPYSIVGVNVTLLLADLLSLKDNKYLSVQSNYWTLFEDPTAFFEMFCICFQHIDSIWTHRKATRADFGKIIGETKTLVKSALNQGPKTVQEFKFAVADEGMMVHDLYE